MTESLLGPFIQRVPSVSEMRDWLLLTRPNVVLTMENSTAEAILGNRPADWNPIVIGRKHFGSQPLENARGVARSIYDSQWRELCDQGTVTHMMLYNEISPHGGEWVPYINWERAALDELTYYDIRYVAGSWSVGCPDELYYRCFSCAWQTPYPVTTCIHCSESMEKRIAYWDDERVHVLMREVAQAGGLLGLHQYNAPSVQDIRDFDPQPEDIWDPTINTSWRILRHRKALAQLRDHLQEEDIPDLVVSECGVECGAVTWPIAGIRPGELAGWQTTQTPGQYMDGLRWLDFQCRHDPKAKGLAVFIMGTHLKQADGSEGDWVTHDVWGIREQFGEAIRNPLPIEEPPPPPPPPPPTTDLGDWIEGEVAAGSVDELPFVPENFIEALGLRMGWVPTSDEWMLVPPERFGLRRVFVKIFVAPCLGGGHEKKIVWWEHGDWENFKVIATSL